LEWHHGSDPALGAETESSQKVVVVGGPRQQIRTRRGQQVATHCELIGAMAVGQEAVVTDALETRGQGVLQEEADELLGGHGHHLAKRVTVVSPGKRDMAVLEGEQAVVADRDAVGIAAEIFQHVSRSPERGFGIHDPLFVPERS